MPLHDDYTEEEHAQDYVAGKREGGLLTPSSVAPESILLNASPPRRIQWVLPVNRFHRGQLTSGSHSS